MKTDNPANNPSREELLGMLERYELALRGSADGLWDWDLPGKTIYFSSHWKSQIGFSDPEIRDDPEEWFGRVHDRDAAGLKKALEAHLSGQTPRFEQEYRLLHKNRAYRWMLCRGTAVRDAAGRAVRIAGSQIDITDRRNDTEHLNQALDDLKLALASEKVLMEELDRKNKELTELSITDGLTHLYNHRHLQDRLDFEFKRSKRYGTPLSCILLDIDHFKSVNDTHGHQAGDEVLKGIARLVLTQTRETDLCGRYGGEEFMILAGLSLDDAMRFAARLNRAVAKSGFNAGGVCLRATVSIGVAALGSDVKTKQELIERADRAMYRAKREGRDRVCEWKESAAGGEAAAGRTGADGLRRKLADLSDRMRATAVESTNALVNAVGAKDHAMREHSRNVAGYSVMVAKAMKLPEKSVEIIRNAALLHDVGKIGVPLAILAKQGGLTPEEYEVVKKHPLIGVDILRDVKFLEKEVPFILHHHERFDGSGYPHNLKGREIPFGARILAVAEAFDAMTVNRIYGNKRSPAEAVQELKQCSGTQFDPGVVELFVKLAGDRTLTPSPS